MVLRYWHGEGVCVLNLLQHCVALSGGEAVDSTPSLHKRHSTLLPPHCKLTVVVTWALKVGVPSTHCLCSTCPPHIFQCGVEQQAAISPYCFAMLACTGVAFEQRSRSKQRPSRNWSSAQV